MATDDELILDVDFRNGGHYSWRSLQANYGKVARTYREKAANGWHRHFQRPPFPVCSSKGLLGRGIDIITGPDHYVVVYPSYTQTAYTIHDDVTLAPLPEYLLDLLLTESPFVHEPGVKIQQGHRNYWLWTQGVRRLQDVELTTKELEAHLWDLYQSECEKGTDPMQRAEMRRIAVGCLRRLSSLRRGIA